jgi:hypothetical protein
MTILRLIYDAFAVMVFGGIGWCLWKISEKILNEVCF